MNTKLTWLQRFAHLLVVLGIWEWSIGVFQALEWLPLPIFKKAEEIAELTTIAGLTIGAALSIAALSMLRRAANGIARKLITSDESEEDGPDEDYVCLVSASLVGLVGMLVVLTEVVGKFSNQAQTLDFVSEEVLLGFSGIFMLIEEFKLLNENREARNRTAQLMNEINDKTEEARRLHKEVVCLHENVDVLHKGVKERIDKVGPAIISTVTEIFREDH